MNKAIVIGVGPREGLGGELCARFAREGHHVFIGGRTEQKSFEVDLRTSVENW